MKFPEKRPERPLLRVGFYHKKHGDHPRGPSKGPKAARDVLRAAVTGIRSTGQKKGYRQTSQHSHLFQN